jgi:hypothetical protein
MGKAVNPGIEWGGMTEEMRKGLMTKTDADSSRANTSNFGMGVSGDGEERAALGGGGVSDLSFRNVPKKFNFWFGLKLAAQDKSE